MKEKNEEKKVRKPVKGELKLIEEPKKTYKLNKSKVRKKCSAFSRLEKSKKFLAFYSISFPKGLPDKNAYKIFNTWLTRCRKNSGLKSYLWVAERQKNLTVHFHLLTNDFMAIRIVNGFMAKALKTEKKTGNDALKEVNTEVYNGVHVKKVGNNGKSLIGYLIKYVGKNNIEFYRLPWHCSRDVSVLNTSTNFNEPNEKKYFDKLPRFHNKSELEDLYRVTKTPNYNCAGFKFLPDEDLYAELDSINEVIYNEYHKKKKNIKESRKNEK